MRRRMRTKDINYIRVNRPLTDTVPNGTRQWKDIIMKLYCVFAAVLAISLAKEIEDHEIEDLEAAASVELLRTDREAKEEILDTAASYYNAIPPSQRPPRPWNPPQNYIPSNPPQNTWNNPNNYNPTPAPIYPPLNNYNPSQNQNYVPVAPQVPQVPQNDYVPPQNNYQPSPPQNTNYQPPQNTNYQPPQNTNYQPPQNTNYQPTIPPQTPLNPQAPQNDYYYPQNTWTTTQAVPVIKNEQFFGENGNYKYEYQIGDGTHVGEEGYLTNPNTDHESVVKKGWYSFVGGDGKLYTVKWWADDSGFHAFGDHLPTPPPAHPAIQAALDQAAKDEANKPQTGYYPQSTQPPTYYPKPTQQPTYYPNNNYYPQPAYQPQQQYPNFVGK